MKCIELNKKGDFERWDPALLAELRGSRSNEPGDEDLIFERDGLKVSLIGLESYERCPFRTLTTDFNLVCLTGGLALSRNANGQISLLIFEKGENVPFHVNNSKMTIDLQNIGESPLAFGLIELGLNEKANQYLADIIRELTLAS